MHRNYSKIVCKKFNFFVSISKFVPFVNGDGAKRRPGDLPRLHLSSLLLQPTIFHVLFIPASPHQFIKLNLIYLFSFHRLQPVLNTRKKQMAMWHNVRHYYVIFNLI